MPTSRVSTPWAARACSRTCPASSMARRSMVAAAVRCSRVRGGSFHTAPAPRGGGGAGGGGGGAGRGGRGGGPPPPRPPPGPGGVGGFSPRRHGVLGQVHLDLGAANPGPSDHLGIGSRRRLDALDVLDR